MTTAVTLASVVIMTQQEVHWVNWMECMITEAWSCCVVLLTLAAYVSGVYGGSSNACPMYDHVINELAQWPNKT